jgi:hypothetical protein
MMAVIIAGFFAPTTLEFVTTGNDELTYKISYLSHYNTYTGMQHIQNACKVKMA